MEDRYWKFMCTSKYEIFYFDVHLNLYILVNRIIKITSVVLSSISLGMWAILQSYEFLWSTIIVISQIITLVNNILPYKQRIAEISKLKSKLLPIHINIEHEWFKIKNSEYSDSEVNDLISKYSISLFDESNNYFSNDTLPCFEKLRIKATNKMCDYYNNCF